MDWDSIINTRLLAKINQPITTTLIPTTTTMQQEVERQRQEVDRMRQLQEAPMMKLL